MLKEYTNKNSRFVLTSGGWAPVLDGGGGGHSVFARAFIDVLRANNDIISASNVHEAVAPIVLDLAAKQNFDQTPLFGYLRSAKHEFGNFYIPASEIRGAVRRRYRCGQHRARRASCSAG